MKVQVEVSDDLVANVLLEDYQTLRKDIVRLESKKTPLEIFEETDLEDARELTKAIETIVKYYLPIDEANRRLDELKCKS